MAVVFGVCERRAVITVALSFGFSFAFSFAIRLGDRPRCRFPASCEVRDISALGRPFLGHF